MDVADEVEPVVACVALAGYDLVRNHFVGWGRTRYRILIRDFAVVVSQGSYLAELVCAFNAYRYGSANAAQLAIVDLRGVPPPLDVLQRYLLILLIHSRRLA